MKKSEKYFLVFTTLGCLIPILFALTVYNKLPDQIAIHWGMNGEPNGYASKEVAVFGLPILMAILNISVNLISEYDPRKSYVPRKMRIFLKLLLPILCWILYPMTILIALGTPFNIEMIVLVLVGVIFILVGNYMPKFRQNHTVGIRIPWTLRNEEVWNRTHHMAGYLWIIGGVLMMGAGFFQWSEWVILVYIMILVIVPMVYAYLLYKKLEQKD